jgi:hypothetical protein
MKIRRTVTEKVANANRVNSKKSTGPRNVTSSSKNSLRHGLLARYLVFDDEEDSASFEALSAGLAQDYSPTDRTEAALVDEIAVCLWKISKANLFEQSALHDRRRASKSILNAVAAHSGSEPLPLFQCDDGRQSDARRGWMVEELIVRTGTRNSEIREWREDETKNNAGAVQIEARLTNSIETVLRYSNSIRRDLYRAIATLRGLQRERHDALPVRHRKDGHEK